LCAKALQRTGDGQQRGLVGETSGDPADQSQRSLEGQSAAE